ncbi:MAG: LuxR C-terminal-related transcriptional regulator [Bacteroidota bacterium]
MNPLLSNQKLFVLRTINVKNPKENKLVIINEFEGFTNFVENELAVKIFGQKEESRSERIQYARDLLISLIGKDEFLRLKKIFDNDPTQLNSIMLHSVLSKTEVVLFKLIAKGFKQFEIAELLEWSVGKVQYHKKQIYQKMNFNGTSDLLEYANKNRLV